MVALLLVMTIYTASGKSGWTRAIDDGTDIHDRSFKPFLVLVISSIQGRLRGNAVYMNATNSPVLLTGRNATGGDFWIGATAQVASNLNGTWKTLGETKGPGSLATKEIDPNGVNKSLLLDLEIFRAAVKTYTYGRLVLSTGDVAVFRLQDLLPPRSK